MLADSHNRSSDNPLVKGYLRWIYVYMYMYRNVDNVYMYIMYIRTFKFKPKSNLN